MMKTSKTLLAIAIAVIIAGLSLGIGSILPSSSKNNAMTQLTSALNSFVPAPVWFECKSNIFLGKKCDVRLSESIVRPEVYRDLLQLLATAGSYDTITFHMAGNGGRVDATLALQQAFKTTKAHVIASVEGNVYSAHAYLSISMHELKVIPNVDFLFHRSSLYGTTEKICSEAKDQKDRKQDAFVKCNLFLDRLLAQDKRWVLNSLRDILSVKDIERVLAGHDVILLSQDIKEAFDKRAKNV